MKDKINYKKFLIDCIFMVIGNLIYALALKVFIAPNNIAPGGATGIAVMVNYISNLPIGAITLFINIPLLIFALFLLGKIFVIKTLISIVSFTFCFDIVLKDVPIYNEDLILAMLFGGIITGIGSALIFWRNGSGGGSDTIALIVKKFKPHFKTGKLVMTIDIFIISLSVYIFKSINSAMYAIVFRVVSAFVIDKIIYGVDEGKMIIINSINKSDEIREYITKTLSKGVTLINSKGGYSKEGRDLLLCAVSNRGYISLRNAIQAIDPNAFVIVTKTSEVLGLGFKRD
ncbi:MAG: YitT family protein [Oscillospiraceae bacterium]